MKAIGRSVEPPRGRWFPEGLARLQHGRGLRAAASALALFAIVVTVVQPPGAEGARGTPRGMAPHAQVWVGTRATAEILATIDEETTSAFIGSSTAFAIGGWGEAAIQTRAWASAERFAADVAAGSIAAGVRAVMYDPEHWVWTPIEEQRDPVAAMRSFGHLAHRHGYLVVITPHPNLVAVPRGACVAGPAEPIEAAFLGCRIQAAAARYADIVEIQGQHLESDVAAYRGFVTAAARQSRAANPDVTVLSGLSTTFTDDPEVLFQAWRSVFGVVDGHYLNVPHGYRPETAVAFLRMVDAAD
jgi:hypothetical protein